MSYDQIDIQFLIMRKKIMLKRHTEYWEKKYLSLNILFGYYGMGRKTSYNQSRVQQHTNKTMGYSIEVNKKSYILEILFFLTCAESGTLVHNKKENIYKQVFFSPVELGCHQVKGKYCL